MSFFRFQSQSAQIQFPTWFYSEWVFYKKFVVSFSVSKENLGSGCEKRWGRGRKTSMARDMEVVPADPGAAVVPKKKSQMLARSWILLDCTGERTVLDVDKYAIMHRVHIHARDLRILDPLLSYPSTILGREKAIVLNLEVISLFYFIIIIFFCGGRGGEVGGPVGLIVFIFCVLLFLNASRLMSFLFFFFFTFWFFSISRQLSLPKRLLSLSLSLPPLNTVNLLIRSRRLSLRFHCQRCFAVYSE